MTDMWNWLKEASRAIGVLVVVFGALWTVVRPVAADFVKDVVDEKLEQRIQVLEKSLEQLKINDGSRKEQLKHISEDQDEIKELIIRALSKEGD